MTRGLFILFCFACLALSQMPPVVRTVSTTTNVVRVVEIGGKLVTNTITLTGGKTNKPWTGIRQSWQHDGPAEFISFRIYGQTNHGNTNLFLIATTTNRFYDLSVSNGQPQMYVERIDAVDVALPKTSLGRAK